MSLDICDQSADALIPAEGNMGGDDMASQRLHCGVIEPIMLDIVTTQSTGESLQSPYQP